MYLYLFKNWINDNTTDLKFVKENLKHVLNTFISNNKEKWKLSKNNYFVIYIFIIKIDNE